MTAKDKLQLIDKYLDSEYPRSWGTVPYEYIFRARRNIDGDKTEVFEKEICDLYDQYNGEFV